MNWISRNVPALDAKATEKSEAGKIVRRTEITVHRKVCSVEIHGAVLENATHCPVCGQSLPGPAGPILDLTTRDAAQPLPLLNQEEEK